MYEITRFRLSLCYSNYHYYDQYYFIIHKEGCITNQREN